MSHVKVRGIILREVDYKDADRILDILTPELGLITASARGARRQKSPLLHATQAMGFCDFELFHHSRSGMYSVDAASRVADFRCIREDMSRLVCASHLLELMGDAARDDPAGAKELFRLIAITLVALNQPDKNPMLVVRTMEIRLMCDIGFAPVLNTCTVCDGELPSQGIRFSYDMCGVICHRPACIRIAGQTEPIRQGTLACMRYIRDTPAEKLHHFRLEREDQDVLSVISERFVTDRMEKKYKKLDMLASL